jgi:hypothetical protein
MSNVMKSKEKRRGKKSCADRLFIQVKKIGVLNSDIISASFIATHSRIQILAGKTSALFTHPSIHDKPVCFIQCKEGGPTFTGQ